MKIEGTPKPTGPDARRFSVGKAAPKEGANSFRDALKKASAAPSSPVQSAPASGPEPTASSLSSASSASSAQVDPASETESGTVAASTSFADHMEMVKLRLKSGYYTGKNMDEALSDRLTGYFDDLA